MKKNRFILRITIVLAILAAYLYFTKNPWTIKKELRDFAIRDTASVTKIFLADKTGKQITLEKISSGKWEVNGKYTARNESVNMLLHTMMKLEVKNPVAKAAMEGVLKHMSANATKVEIYQNNSLSKTYYVGGATQDQLGTFMLLENSTAPFVMDLPGLNGYLTSRYFTEENQWKSRVVFNYNPAQIISASVVYPDSSAKSFMLRKDRANTFFISHGNTKSDEIRVSDTLRAFNFYSHFSNLQYEVAVSGISKQKKDSVLASVPLCVINVNSMSTGDNINKTIKFFLLPVNEHSLMKGNENGPLTHDVDRMYGLIDDQELVIVQHFVFDKVMRSYSEFVKN